MKDGSMLQLTGPDTVGLAGDWHGNTLWARSAIYTMAQHGIKRIYHLGDFGLFWPGGWGKFFNEVQGACARFDVELLITPGNHENWEQINARKPAEDGLIHLSNHIKILPRGFRWTDNGRTFVSLGGAPSIDFPHRLRGRSWWPEEMITLEEAEKVAEDGYADVFLAHDAPDGGTEQVQAIVNTPAHKTMWTDQGLRYAREGRELMNIALRGVKPHVFAHGHFHVGGERWNGETQFLSLNCDGWGFRDNLVALDLGTFEHRWVDLQEIPRF